MRRDQKRKVRLCDLVVDYAVYPRQSVDDVHVGDLALALRSGADLPPMVIDAATNRIVDGVHRHRALIRVLGAESVVEVTARHYDSEADLFLDAARLNGTHGRKFSHSDQVRVVNTAQALGVTDNTQIARVLAIPVERVEKIAIRIVITESGERIPNKRASEHKQGEVLSPERIAVIRSWGRDTPLTVIRRLANLLEQDLVDFRDPVLCQELHDLADLIRERVPLREPQVA
jgi:hypothetical protein